MPFGPSSDDAWWPNPWPPRNASVGRTSYPGDWTDPFVNSRATTPDPLASGPVPFSAAQLGAMAWRPPIFPGDWSSFVPNNFSTAAWPQPVPPAVPTSGPDLTTAPGWPYPRSILAQLAQFAAPAAPRPLDNSGGLFSRDPSIPIGGGLFPYPLGSDPDPTSPFGSGFVGTGGGAASSRTLGMPGTSSAPGWPAPPSWPAPLPQLQDPFAAGGPALDPSNGLPASPSDAPPPSPSTRSPPFNQLPAAPDPGVSDRDQADLDQTAQSLRANGLPISKSGQPLAPSPPVLSTAREQALYAAQFLSPNLVDYFTKTPPPAPPLPATPTKIPGTDNPYALGAALEAATFFLPQRRIVAPLESAASILGKSVLEAASRAAKNAVDARALTRIGEELGAQPYGELSGTLPAGWQAHHLSQNAVYGSVIPRSEGLSVALPGNALSDPGTSHFVAHQWLEQQFWNQYREGGSLLFRPTNAEYGEAGRLSLIAGGVPPAQAYDFAAQAAAQRTAKGLSETAPVPRIPGSINQKR